MAGMKKVHECKKAVIESNRELGKAQRKIKRIEVDIAKKKTLLYGDAARDRPVNTRLYQLGQNLKEAQGDFETWDMEHTRRKAALVKAGWDW